MLKTKSEIQPKERLALGINEAAALSGLSRATLYRLIGAKKLPSRKVGKRRLILPADLESMLKGGADER
jgi:excisionase family DNA binding protein